jgi:REP element-mobilizing transposase RayT
MARPLRLEFPGAVYHVTSRGNARAAVYRDDDDRRTFLRVLAETTLRRGWRCHAFCLMTNHYHLLLETPAPTLSRGMRDLDGIYGQAFNRRHRRPGHVFQGRFKAILVERDTHLLELCRYVVLNPVRARMVREPGDWPWSSYAATAGLADAPAWLATDWVLAQFGHDAEQARASYGSFVAAARDDDRSIWNDLKGQIWLGTPAWIERMQAMIPASGAGLADIPKAQRRPAPLPLAAYAARHRDRNTAIRAAYASGAFTLRQIAAFFGIHESTASRVLRGCTKTPCRLISKPI